MEKRVLGKTGMHVSVLGFGGSEIGFLGASVESVEQLLGRALDSGLNVVDTAECYADSEEKIGQAISHRRSDFFLFTKLGHRFQGGPEHPDWSEELLRGSIENSLTKLKTDAVDLLQIHSCGREVLEEGTVLRVLDDAKREGKTRFVGYSGDGDDAVFALSLDVFDTLQTSVNIADQQVIDLVLPVAREKQIGVIAKRPVANVAWLRDQLTETAYAYPYRVRLDALDYPFLHQDHDVQMALEFTLSTPGVHVAIVGTQNPERWRENAVGLQEPKLTPDLYASIRERWHEVSAPDWVGLT
jgi:hypothetical protein